MTSEILKQIDDLEKIMSETIIDPENKSVVILDGIVDTDRYYSAKYKILWILKEPNDTNLNEDGIIGNWDMRRFILDDVRGYKHWKRTYLPIVYSVWGIFNNFCLWNDMDDYDNCPEMLDVLQEIAFINIKKIPGTSRSEEYKIAQAYSLYKNIILKQIELFSPDIIICGGTIHHLLNDLSIPFDKLQEQHYYINKNKIYISNYHPNQRTIKQSEYCNHIINSAKEWANRAK